MDIQRLAPCITCHSWNADGTKVALCPNNTEIHIYKKSGSSYTLETKLCEHDQVVTGIDWAPKSNRIVSCSQDRNAYVWTFQNGQWKPVLVILRINRAATYVKWSPEENKFAVASGAKCVSVCYFEEDNDWWVSKHIKKHRSTVLRLDWHPNNHLLATASSDYRCRIVNAFIKGVDKKAPNPNLGGNLPFGEIFAEFDQSLGWVQTVRFSPSGNTLVFCGQDSTVNFVDVPSGQVQTIKTRDLPFADTLFMSEDSVVCVGHDFTPVLFQKKGDWKMIRKLDQGGDSAAKGPAKNAAFEKFKSQVDYGVDQSESKLSTKHQNCITYICPFKRSGPNVSQYSTSGLDGQLAVWDARF